MRFSVPAGRMAGDVLPDVFRLAVRADDAVVVSALPHGEVVNAEVKAHRPRHGGCVPADDGRDGPGNHRTDRAVVAAAVVAAAIPNRTCT